jgi:hypothetical protein
MTPIFPVIELFDRLAIAEVKWERIHANAEELAWYNDQVSQYNFNLVSDIFLDLKEIHNTIWDLEWQLKTGVEEQLTLEEIGRRAIAIRDMNNKRIRVKNIMAERLKCPVREIKKEHLSQ